MSGGLGERGTVRFAKGAAESVGHEGRGQQKGPFREGMAQKSRFAAQERGTLLWKAVLSCVPHCETESPAPAWRNWSPALIPGMENPGWLSCGRGSPGPLEIPREDVPSALQCG